MAKPSVTGWILAAVPALGFLALTKLVLSRPTAPATTTAAPAAQTTTVEAPAVVPAHATPHPAAIAAPDEELIPGARIIAEAYHKATGAPITLDALAERLRVPIATAERLLAALHATEPHRHSPAQLNGTHAVEALA